MALTKERKKEIIKELDQKMDDQKVVIFTGFKGSKNKDLSELRRELKGFDSSLTVAKKTLMKLVFEKKGLEVDYGKLEGEVAVVFGFQDEIMPAKTLLNFSKKNPNIKIIGGILEGDFKNSEEIINLAKLPSREEILARLVGTVQSPMTGFVSVLEGNIKGLINVLSKIK